MKKNRSDNSSIEQSSNKFRDIFSTELTQLPYIQITGNEELTLDGFKGIAEYTNNDVKIKTSCGVVCVNGQNLNIKYLSVSAVVIEGKISCIEFLNKR